MVGGEYISEVYKWYTESRLVVNRRYQRKLVWTLEEKRKFISTILEDYPVPLFLLANTGDNTGKVNSFRKEIIDGLQRLEAIIAFILNKYSVKINDRYQYFNLDAYPGNGSLIRQGKMHQMPPALDLEICKKFLLYQLPVSTINADETVVDDVFKRINSTGRKLSLQDLRQAGVISKFSNLVRIIATHLRGDVSDGNIVNMNEIADYSINGPGLNYGLDVETVFWVEQGIITEEGLRYSKDEEIIAGLCNCILSGYKAGMSSGTLKRLYSEDSDTYKRNEAVLSEEKCESMVKLFRKIISDLESVFQAGGVPFAQLLFQNEKSPNKDLVFIVLFLAFTKLSTEHYEIHDFKTMAVALKGLADRELKGLIETSDCTWNTDVRNHLTERVKNVLVRYMIFKENNPAWNRRFIDLVKQKSTEGQMVDFKIGLHDLRNGRENSFLISKCIKTLTAMANTNPGGTGVIVLGISDKDGDAADFKKYYGIEVPRYNEYFVPGVNEEAERFYGTIQAYLDYLKSSIEKEKVDRMAIHRILTIMDTVKYENSILIVLKLSADKPLFYDGRLYVRYESYNTEILAGSIEYYEVLDLFCAAGVHSKNTNMESKELKAF